MQGRFNAGQNRNLAPAGEIDVAVLPEQAGKAFAIKGYLLVGMANKLAQQLLLVLYELRSRSPFGLRERSQVSCKYLVHADHAEPQLLYNTIR